MESLATGFEMNENSTLRQAVQNQRETIMI